MDPVRTSQMGRLWQGIVSTVFWSYERGSWPYDILVVAILVFVLATPRSWFRDEPRQSLIASSSVHLVSADEGNRTRTYRLDAEILSRDKRTTRPTPELEREAHDMLGRTVVDLRDRTFQVVRIEPALAGDGSVLYYDVIVHL
ncbi:MAG TPA: hypothetical protein VGR97_15125 [Candidatus Acidoferrales bacterium]|nr:hypothetical protein [Candidatus Acidoferrales bacterium]